MATLTIIRRNGYKSDSLRAYRILIDNVRAGEIEEGQIIHFKWSAGKHTVKLKIDWCSSKTFDIDVESDNYETVIECWPASWALTALIYITFKARRYINAELVSHGEIRSDNFREYGNESDT